MLSLEEISEWLQIPIEEIRSSLQYQQLTRLSHQQVRNLLFHLGFSYSKRKLTIAALKGGIGKTFLTLQVAIRAAMKGAKVLLVDLDPEACASNTLLTEGQVNSPNKYTLFDLLAKHYEASAAIIPTKYPGLEIIPASLKLSKADKFFSDVQSLGFLKKLSDGLNYDLILWELPPSFSNLSTAAYLASDKVIIPCTPNIHALESVQLTIKALKELSEQFSIDPIPYHIILNMFNPHRSASQDSLHLLKDEHSEQLLPWTIRESAEVQNAINAGLSLFEVKGSKELRQNLDALAVYLCPLVKNSSTKGTVWPKNFPSVKEKNPIQKRPSPLE